MTKAKAEKIMSSLGVTLDGPRKDPTSYMIEGMLDAPRGMLFDSHGTHCCAVYGDDMPGFWCSVVSELRDTRLIPCDEPNCDICNDE